MAITTTWSVNQMNRIEADGGVTQVSWGLTARSDSGGDAGYRFGSIDLEYDTSSSDFIPFNDLTESAVLDWVWNSSKEEDESASEFKARLETEITAKVQAKLDAATAEGMPWDKGE